MKYCKELLCLISILIIFSGCAKDKQPPMDDPIDYHNAYASIDPDEIEKISSLLEYSINLSDPQAMAENSEYIVLATITSIDGGSNLNEITDKRIHFPYTYGKLKIIRVYQGNLEANQEIEYTRSGGIIPYQDYFESLEERHKVEQAKPEHHLPYVKYLNEDDIEIEAGITYLIYMNRYEESPLRLNAYTIVGWHGGLKEVRTSDKSVTTELTPASKLEVLNNFNQSWEPLNHFIREAK